MATMVLKIKNGTEEYELLGDESIILPLFFSAPCAELVTYGVALTPVHPDSYRPGCLNTDGGILEWVNNLFNDALGG